jgi:hypothetical protein
MIPTTYDAWRHCIEIDCQQPLTADFIASRIAELRDAAHERTAQFVRLYGESHRLRVLGWFERAGAGG